MVSPIAADFNVMPPPKVAKTLARVMGSVLLLIGLIAFVPNPFVGTEGYFQTDFYLNGVYMLFGVTLFAFSTKGEGFAATGLYSVAMLAFVLALFGYVQMSNYNSTGAVKLFDMVTFSSEDVWLIAGTAAILMICGMMNTSSRQIVRD